MDSDAFAQLATAIIDLTGVSHQELMLQNQQAFGVNSADFENKTLGSSSKPELLLHPNDVFVSNMSNPGYYHPNVPVQLSNNEQVPMDDFDPLESFTFWDGETFYCNQDQESGCNVVSTMPAEEEMTDLQSYLLHTEAMTKDDLSQIEDSDLIRNPTLAELNSCREPAFDCSAENSFLSDDSGYLLSPEFLSKSVPLNESNYMHPSPMFTMSNSNAYIGNVNCASFSFAESKNNSQSLLSSSCPVPSRVVPCPQYLNPYDERLMLCPQNSPSSSDSFVKRKEQFSFESHPPSGIHGFSKSPFPDKHLTDLSVLSTSAPPEVTMSARSPQIKSESPALSIRLKQTPPERSLSGFSSLSLSNDDESGSYFDDSDHDLDDFSSDEDLYQFDEGDAFSTSWPPNKEMKGQQRKHRYFWQYNLQARGMKTHNLLPLSEEHDPYKLNDVKDPVFSEECTLPVKHSGKARKGDGNDLTPNPKKLFSIGIELKKLNKLIYNLNPVSEFTAHGKPLSRKEKNKLASRVCRLKKKAQHEANKIKLYGLQQEHKRLLAILYDMKRLIKYKIEHFHETKNRPSFNKLENYLISHEPISVAGNTTEFVNEVLEKTSQGEPEGGLGNL